jgi:PEP-CTERM motif
MRLRHICAVLALFAASTLPTHADTLFVLSGTTFYNGSLSGEIAINTVTGVVDSVSIYVGAEHFSQDFDYASYFDGTEWVSGIGVDADRPDYVTTEDIGLLFDVPSFVGFKGGDICCDSPLYEQGVIIDTVEYGSLEPTIPTASTPEPSTFSLFGIGLIVLGTARRKLFFC